MRLILLFLVASLYSSIAYSQIEETVSFEVTEIKSEFKTINDSYFNFKITNRSDTPLLIPNVIYFNNLSFTNRVDLDFAFEIYKMVDNKWLLLDSCAILGQPLIPEEGYLLREYRKNTCYSIPSMLPISCISNNGDYRIRFIYFPKNKGYKRIQTQWYIFKVVKEPS